MTRARNKAEALVQGATAADRRALVEVQAVNAVPTLATDGVNAGSHDWLHIVIELLDAATSLEWELYTWDDASEKWTLRTDLGSTILAVADSPDGSIVQIAGASRVYLRFPTMTGTFTNGVNAWLSGSSF